MGMPADDEIKFMQRCLDLAGRAEGNTYPNPLVGAVIVHNGIIIGEGYHLRAGEPHAERNAINSVSDPGLLKSSALYVNLEPCNHYGRTPPCTDLIIDAGIRKVVIGTTDTSDKVCGKGMNALKNAGCDVVKGIHEKECRWINRRFFTFNEKRRPYIILKWAQSKDGYLDIDRDKVHYMRPQWISGKPERVLVHRWRAAEQAILAGAGTIRADDPKLNVREWPGSNPMRLILSSSGDLDINASVFHPDGKVVVFTHNINAETGGATRVVLNRHSSSAGQVADYLYNWGLQSLFIEGGSKVLSHFISEGLWDEARIFYGNDLFENGIKAPVIKGTICSKTQFIDSSLEVILNEVNRFS